MYRESAREIRGDDLYDTTAQDIHAGQAGYQTSKLRRPAKLVPPWARNLKRIQEHILAPARHRVRVAYLYYCLGWTAGEVAADLETTEGAVRQILRRMREKEI